MKYNINVIESFWRRWRKPSRATLDAIGSENPRTVPIDGRRTPRNTNYATCAADSEVGRKAQTLDWKRLTQTLDSAVWQHIARLEADRRALLGTAKAVVGSRDVSVDRRPSSVSINLLRETIAKAEGKR
jgi:hypothetical protein